MCVGEATRSDGEHRTGSRFADQVAAKLGFSLKPNPDLHLLECPARVLLRLDDVRVANLLIDVEDDMSRLKGER